MNRPASAIGAIALTIGLATSNQAEAAAIYRDHFSHGTANCQSALPVFDGNIRKRPQAVSNEGVSTAFMTCDSENIRFQTQSFSLVAVYFRNRGTSTVTVSCTLVNGVFDGNAAFLPKTTLLGPEATTSLQWSSLDDNGGFGFLAPAISCALPPGTEIGMVRFRYAEEIGD